MARPIMTMAEGGFAPRDYMIDADCVAGAVALRNSTAASAGEVVNPSSVTVLTHAMGVYGESVIYTVAPTKDNNMVIPKPVGLMGTCRIVSDPMAIFEFRVAGGATSGTALANTVASKSNILTNTVADATKLIVTSAGAGAVSFVGGLIKGRSGANKGQTRRIITHNANVDQRVEVAFLNDIAVGDTFITVPYSKAGVAMQMTTDFTEANGLIATGTGGVVGVVDVLIGVDDCYPGKDNVLVQVVFADHFLNRIA